MEAFWSKENPVDLLLRNRDDLIKAKASGRLPDILRYHIAEVFRQFAGASDHNEWSKAYLQAEQTRLHSVLSQWLDYEIDRQFFTVEEREKEVLAQINGLQLKLRVDRIDRVDGGRLILDYKTSKVSAAMWEGVRPDEPQLPLYGIHGPVDDLRGVLFAQVRTGDTSFVGRAKDVTRTVTNKLSAQSALIKNPLTKDTIGEWAAALSNLADQFLSGDATVAPKSYPKTCKYCALPSLCRVAETPAAVEAEDDEEEIDEIGEDSSNG